MGTDYKEGDKVSIMLQGRSRPAIVFRATGQNRYILKVALQDFGGGWHISDSRPTAGAKILPGRVTTIPGLDGTKQCVCDYENPMYAEQCLKCGQDLTEEMNL